MDVERNNDGAAGIQSNEYHDASENEGRESAKESQFAPSLAKGKGQLLTDDRHLRLDLRMIQRAIERNWEIPDDAYSIGPQQVAQLLHHANPKVVLDAMRVLDSMDRTNITRAQAMRPLSPRQTVNATTINVSQGDGLTDQQRQTLADAARLMATRLPAPDQPQ